MSFTETVVGTALPLLGDAIRAIRREYARRLDEGGTAALANLDLEIDEALDILSRDAATPIGDAKAFIKGWISRPDIFRHSRPSQWVATQLVRDSVKGAILAHIRDEPAEPFATAAIHHYDVFSDLDDGTAVDGSAAWAEACAYVIKSLQRDLSTSDRIILEAIGGLRAKIDRNGHPAGTAEIYDAHIDRAVERLRRRRFFTSANTSADARDLAETIEQLDGASASVRARALAWCSRWLNPTDLERSRHVLGLAKILGSRKQVEIDIASAMLAFRAEGLDALSHIEIDASPLHATAALQLICRDRDHAEAMALAEQAGIGFDLLDSDGRYVLIVTQIGADRWDSAIASVRRLTEDDYKQTPVLYWVGATVIVADSLAPDLRPAILGGIPVHPARFPLPEDLPAVTERRLAGALMEKVASECDTLELPREAMGARLFQLWLGLRDRDHKADALDALKMRVRDPSTAVGYLPLAIDFNVGVDRADADRRLHQHLARHPAGDPEWALAQFSLILANAGEASDQALESLQKHWQLLTQYLSQGGLRGLEIQLLIDLDRHAEARNLLSSPESCDLPDSIRVRLQSLLDGTLRPDVDTLETLYAKAPTLALLGDLVAQYQEQGFSERYLEHARALVRQSRSVDYARSIFDFLVQRGQHEAAADLLSENSDLVDGSPDLLSRAAWVAFEGGRLSETETALARLEGTRDDAADRQLRYALLLASGRWPELDAFVEREWARRHLRDTEELSWLAKLASHLGSERTRELIDLIVASAPDDPKALVAAYIAATHAGLENTISDAGRWIVRAAELSGDDGPVREGSIETLIADKGEGDQRVESAWRAFADASTPLLGVAIMLRRPWLELQVVPALANESRREPRERSIIPLFGGKRGPVTEHMEPTIGAISLDRTAIMTLAMLRLLDPVLQACSEIHIAHDTLTDLFEQRHRLAFHQPSKVAFAHSLTGLINRSALKVFEPASSPDPSLSAETGMALAALLQEASSHTDSQHLVVHPYPITRVGSWLNEPIDLSRFAGHLVSCSSIVDYLDRDGRLTRQEIKDARTYLRQVDQTWPSQPAIRAGATLYLSDLSVEYLRHTGLLNKIVAADVDVVVSPSEIAEARALLEHERMSDTMGELIEDTRRLVATAIADGRVSLDKSCRDEDDRASLMSIARLAERAPILVCDDRFINQYDRFDGRQRQTRILTSLQLCEGLAASGRLDGGSLRDVRTRLRRMGVMCVPLDKAELVGMVEHAEISEGELRETGELRALRENARLMQFRGWLNPQVDALWLLNFENALVDTLVAQWSDEIDDEIARARSRWILGLSDLRDWAVNIDRARSIGLAEAGAVLMIAKLATSTFNLGDEAKHRFASWLEKDVVKPLWDREPDLREMTLAHLRQTIVALDEEAVLRGAHSKLPPDLGLEIALSNFPDFLQIAMAEDTEFRRTLGIEFRGTVTLGFGVAEFDRDTFFDTIRAAYAAPGQASLIEDLSGRDWQARTAKNDGAWPIVLESGETRYTLSEIFGCHPDSTARLHDFELAADRVDLPVLERIEWRARLNASTLDPQEIDRLAVDLADTPQAFTEALRASLRANTAPLELLVPRSARYYRRLIHDDAASTLASYVQNTVHECLAPKIGDKGLDTARTVLLLGSHHSIIAAAGISRLPVVKLERLGRWVKDEGDLLAKVGFIEAAIGRATPGSVLEEITLSLIREIEALPDREEDGRLFYLSALYMLVDGELSRNGALSQWPPFRRRIAAFAQAALIERETFDKIGRAQFTRAAMSDRGWDFFVQSLVDLRQEPRWRPDYAMPEQLKNEFIGRIVNRAGEIGLDDLSDALRHLILGDGPGCLAPGERYPRTNWPGPIEGATNVELELPPPVLQAQIEEAIRGAAIAISDLYVLFNINGVFRLPSSLVDEVADHVRSSGPRLFPEHTAATPYDALVGLAHLAASNRHKDLADQVRHLAHRRRRSGTVAIEDDLHLACVAAAAVENIADWRDTLADWFFELATSSTRESAHQLMAWLDRLCAIDPLFRAWTGRARAALALLLGV